MTREHATPESVWTSPELVDGLNWFRACASHPSTNPGPFDTAPVRRNTRVRTETQQRRRTRPDFPHTESHANLCARNQEVCVNQRPTRRASNRMPSETR